LSDKKRRKDGEQNTEEAEAEKVALKSRKEQGKKYMYSYETRSRRRESFLLCPSSSSSSTHVSLPVSSSRLVSLGQQVVQASSF